MFDAAMLFLGIEAVRLRSVALFVRLGVIKREETGLFGLRQRRRRDDRRTDVGVAYMLMMTPNQTRKRKLREENLHKIENACEQGTAKARPPLAREVRAGDVGQSRSVDDNQWPLLASFHLFVR